MGSRGLVARGMPAVVRGWGAEEEAEFSKGFSGGSGVRMRGTLDGVEKEIPIPCAVDGLFSNEVDSAQEGWVPRVRQAKPGEGGSGTYAYAYDHIVILGSIPDKRRPCRGVTRLESVLEE